MIIALVRTEVGDLTHRWNVDWMIWQWRSRVLKWCKAFEIVITLIGTFPNLEINIQVCVRDFTVALFVMVKKTHREQNKKAL